MFTKILIANRGEIACRVAATAARLGLRTVAVYSDADAQARHVQLCDEALPIGGSAAADSYLRGDAIIAAALASGAQAVHPGYGFLSENADFARACTQAGLVFIGPPPAAIGAMGRKAQAKQLMERAGVPLVPGYHGADQAPELLRRHADAIGYPVLIKASAGGGGKGMRVVESADAFGAALQSCQREAQASFGDAAVLLEKYVQRPRHIEIQVFADQHGQCVHLFERDCSVQRRHQKVLEEAPAPGLSPDLRARMGAAAVAAARAVGYVGAGTVEFIVEQDTDGGMAFFFMEMNTRLQVEHPVTEAIVGVDLVEWQLRIASGDPLPLRQDQLAIHGHAIEARIGAEAPDQQFLPATGVLRHLRLPPCSAFAPAPHGVRVDAGVRQGDAISPHYDPMLAKLIVHGQDRAEALARLDAALARTQVVGVASNVQFLRHVVQSPSFAQARLDTALIAREAAVLFDQDRVGVPWSLAALVAQVLREEQQAERAQAAAAGPGAGAGAGAVWIDPWARRDHWRAYSPAERRFSALYRGSAVGARLVWDAAGQMTLACEGAPDGGPFAWRVLEGDALELHWAGQRRTWEVVRDGDDVHLFGRDGAACITEVDRLAHAGDAPPEAGRLTAPMPGKVLFFAVQPGARVSRGQALAVMEAMKMEHTISAPADGLVAELYFAPGDQVAEGAALLRLEEAPAPSAASAAPPSEGVQQGAPGAQ